MDIERAKVDEALPIWIKAAGVHGRTGAEAIPSDRLRQCGCGWRGHLQCSSATIT
jgi:hypothetical protein